MFAFFISETPCKRDQHEQSTAQGDGDAKDIKRSPVSNSKPLHTIEDIVRDTNTNKGLHKTVDSQDIALVKSAFQYTSVNNIHNNLHLWKQQHMFLPNIYSLPMTSSSYDHVTARQMSSALALRYHT